jgi:hypothetical protein
MGSKLIVLKHHKDYGFIERREEVSCTLFFKEDNESQYPTLINIFYTTRGIMTRLSHPHKGYNSLWRSGAYDSLESLAMLFDNPRTHTGKGYRPAKDAVRGCAKCGTQKKRGEFSGNQWRAGAGNSVCMDCIDSKKDKKSDVGDITQGIDQLGLGGGGGLSEEALNRHNQQTASKPITNLETVMNGMERRQYNCPICPMEGRGKQVFFKKVPANKPIVKCFKCKKVKRGDCNRLYPILKGEEKGYGLFRCSECHNTWGSSRAIGSIGQQCQVCSLAGSPNTFVKPFRMELVKNQKGINGGGPRPAGRRTKRVPREVILEDSEEITQYTPSDNQRFQNRGGNALAGTGATGAGRSYDFVPVDNRTPEADSVPSTSRLQTYKFVHKCEGCASGKCRSRKLPISGIHDVHDGDTVSTSGSILTNSEVDKAEFADRDIDFDDWEEDDKTDSWVTVGSSGRPLM